MTFDVDCEDYLMKLYREENFPVTIIRPSHTYDERSVPLGVHGDKGSWQVVKRIKEGKPVIIHGDGTSLWTITHNSDFAKGFTGSLIGDKANSVVFDCSKLKSLVPDFVATKRADQGIRETIEYVLAHPECQVEDPDFDKWCDEIIERMK